MTDLSPKTLAVLKRTAVRAALEPARLRTAYLIRGYAVASGFARLCAELVPEAAAPCLYSAATGKVDADPPRIRALVRAEGAVDYFAQSVPYVRLPLAELAAALDRVVGKRKKIEIPERVSFGVCGETLTMTRLSPPKMPGFDSREPKPRVPLDDCAVIHAQRPTDPSNPRNDAVHYDGRLLQAAVEFLRDGRRKVVLDLMWNPADDYAGGRAPLLLADPERGRFVAIAPLFTDR